MPNLKKNVCHRTDILRPSVSEWFEDRGRKKLPTKKLEKNLLSGRVNNCQFPFLFYVHFRFLYVCILWLLYVQAVKMGLSGTADWRVVCY